MNTTGSPKAEQRKGLDFAATTAIRDAVLDGSLKLILFTLASRTNPNTHTWSISQERLALEAGVSRKTVQRKSETLMRMGLMSRRFCRDSWFGNVYEYTLNVAEIEKLNRVEEVLRAKRHSVQPKATFCPDNATFCPTQCDSQSHTETNTETKTETESIASKLAITPSGESSPDEDGEESTQEEEKGGGAGPVQLIASAWIRLLKERGQPFVDLSQKELGQLGQFGKKLRAQDIDPEKVLTYVVEHWTPFTRDAQKHHGAFKSALPKEPTTGFLLRFRNAAVQMYLEDMENQEQTIPSPLPSIEPVPDSGDPKPVAVLPIIPMTTDSSWLEDY